MIAGSEKALISSTKQKNSDLVFAVIFFYSPVPLFRGATL
jgi:hypothetical protein